MSSTCNWCQAGLACKDHPNAPRPPPPPHWPPTSTEPTAPSKLPKPVHIFLPSHPVTLAKPFNEHSESEWARIVATHLSSVASSSGTKRKSSDTPASDPPPTSKQARTTADEQPPAPKTPSPAAPLLVSAAWDLWRCLQGCSSREPPKQADLRKIQDEDVVYQHSQLAKYFRRPMGEYLRCIHCLGDSGRWTTWTNRQGGITRRIREHMEKYHSEVFLPRVTPVYAPTPGSADYSGLEYSPESFAKCLAQWIAVDDQAMNVVESPEFRKLLVLASRAPNLQDDDIPHRTKATKSIGELYIEEKECIKHDLQYAQNSRGRVSVTSDLWSDGNLRSFMAVTVHYINREGYLAEHLIAFRRVKGHHTGANLGRILFSIFEEFGIAYKLGHITLDNASNNDTLMEELEHVFRERGLITFGRTMNRIRCFPHVINLCVKTFLSELAKAAQSFREKAARDGYTLDEDVLDYLLALESGTVESVRESVQAMHKTNLRRDGFTESIKLGNFHSWFGTENGKSIILPVLQLLRDSDTRWSSTYYMIKRYLQLYPAVLRYSLDHPDMKIPLVSHRQYEVLEDIVSILSDLDGAQELLSAERTPTLALALPVYENLIKALRNRAFEFPMLQHAIECGISKLDAYVATTRTTPVYTTAMAINPCLKFRWIDAHWGRIRRNEARIELKERMLEVRQRQHRASAASAVHTETSTERATRVQANGYMRLLKLSGDDHRRPDTRKALQYGRPSNSNPGLSTVPSSSPPPPSPSQSADDLLRRHMAEVDAELLRWEAFDEYDEKSMGTLNMVDFWKAHHCGFPLIYQVAMDVLPVQASSVSSERAFSSSKMTCTRERSKISAENMEYLQVLKHSLHRRRGNEENHQTLDFMAHVVGSSSEDENDAESWN